MRSGEGCGVPADPGYVVERRQDDAPGSEGDVVKLVLRLFHAHFEAVRWVGGAVLGGNRQIEVDKQGILILFNVLILIPNLVVFCVSPSLVVLHFSPGKQLLCSGLSSYLKCRKLVKEVHEGNWPTAAHSRGTEKAKILL